jgi:hypothetical protein
MADIFLVVGCVMVPILWSSIVAEMFPINFLSSNFGQKI